MTTHSQPSEDKGTYFIDAESATEMARLTHQDLLVTQGMGGVFPEQSDLTNLHEVLDIACGPGGWLLEVAREHPEMQLTGIDISSTMIEYARAHARARNFDNVSFRGMNALKPLDFPANSFDLVNARLIGGFMPKSAWPKLMQEIMRILRPGGIIRLTECEIGMCGITNSPATEQLNVMGTRAMQLAGHSFSPDGRNVGITPMLGRILRDAGYDKIQKRAHAIEYSAGTEAHEGFYQDFTVGFKLLEPFLTKFGVTSQEEFQQVYEQMMTEMHSEDFCALWYFLTVWGEKPQGV